ncbi:GroES-like protein [Hypoxylon cercidicola]|nr:GroES-like protein [Hypoxylon cercidicola]
MPSFTVFKGQDNGQPKKTTTSHPDQLVGDKVLVKVTASGLCGTDLHYKTQRTKDMVLGHEGCGVVEDLGPDCKHLKKGDRVGWGFSTDSCGCCDECLDSAEQFCPQRGIYGQASFDQGSFASHAVWRESFLHKTPDGLTDVEAAPLQCGGATTFAALHDVLPGEMVGIIGMGGLGHLAIQFANKLGCRVVVLSGSDRKKEEAFKLGASEFVAMKNVKTPTVSKPLKRLLVTTSAQPDWEAIFPVMAPRSTIYPLSVSESQLEVPYLPLIFQGIGVQGSLVASRIQHRRMLEFAALHGVKPIVERFPMTEEGIGQAMQKLEEGKMYYRAVLIVE